MFEEIYSILFVWDTLLGVIQLLYTEHVESLSFFFSTSPKTWCVHVGKTNRGDGKYTVSSFSLFLTPALDEKRKTQ